MHSSLLFPFTTEKFKIRPMYFFVSHKRTFIIIQCGQKRLVERVVEGFFIFENLGSRCSRHIVRLIFFSLLSFSAIIGLRRGLLGNPSALWLSVNAHLLWFKF